MSWSELTGSSAPRLRRSASETARFGISVDRLSVPGAAELDDGAVRELAASSTADLVVLRYAATRVGLFAGLLGIDRDVIAADQLAYWSLSTGSGRRPVPVRGIGAGPLNDGDLDLVGALVGEIFTDYGNHYAADPALDPAAALAGYQEWAVASARSAHAIALRRDQEVIGLATTATADDVLEIELAGMRPDHQGQGWYGHLLAGVEDRAAEQGAGRILISTQAHNTGVQRAWSRYGFEPVLVLSTVHLLRRGLLPD